MLALAPDYTASVVHHATRACARHTPETRLALVHGRGALMYREERELDQAAIRPFRTKLEKPDSDRITALFRARGDGDGALSRREVMERIRLVLRERGALLAEEEASLIRRQEDPALGQERLMLDTIAGWVGAADWEEVAAATDGPLVQRFVVYLEREKRQALERLGAIRERLRIDRPSLSEDALQDALLLLADRQLKRVFGHFEPEPTERELVSGLPRCMLIRFATNQEHHARDNREILCGEEDGRHAPTAPAAPRNEPNALAGLLEQEELARRREAKDRAYEIFEPLMERPVMRWHLEGPLSRRGAAWLLRCRPETISRKRALHRWVARVLAEDPSLTITRAGRIAKRRLDKARKPKTPKEDDPPGET